MRNKVFDYSVVKAQEAVADCISAHRKIGEVKLTSKKITKYLRNLKGIDAKETLNLFYIMTDAFLNSLGCKQISRFTISI